MIRTRLLTPGRWMLGLVVLAGLMTGCQSDLQREYDALYAENVELRQQLEGKSQALLAAEAERDAALAQLAAQQPAAGGIRTGFEGIEGTTTTVDAGGEITVTGESDVLFASGSATLREAAKRSLTQVASVLKARYPDSRIGIKGHTDSDPIKKSKWKDNLELSVARAMSVQRYLMTQGISADRMYTSGFGETKPVAPNTTPAGKAKNRRVEIVVHP